jgi:hypothetical protein
MEARPVTLTAEAWAVVDKHVAGAGYSGWEQFAAEALMSRVH